MCQTLDDRLIIQCIGQAGDNLNVLVVTGSNTNHQTGNVIFFFTEAHAKLRPVESPTAGIFLSGTCQGPKDIPETVSQAGAAASKVIGLLAKDKLLGNPCVAHSDEMMCNGCSTCERVCPYGAITYIDKEFRMPDRTTKVRRVASVNEAVCQGCGACTVACPSGAMDLKGFLNRQIMAEVDAICK